MKSEYLLELDDIQKRVIVEQFEKKIEEIEEKIKDLILRKKSFIDLVDKLNHTDYSYNQERAIEPVNLSSNSTYNEAWTWFQKVEYVLKKHNRFLRARDFVETILDLEPKKQTDKREKLRKPVSGCLSKASKDGRLIFKTTDSEMIYGLPEWEEKETINNNNEDLTYGSKINNTAIQNPLF